MASKQDNGRVDGRRFGGRLRRYARVTTTMGGLAARVAGERYLGWDIDRAKHAADLRQALGGLKGPIMKVAQILSTIPDALPPEYADELAGLQAEPQPWDGCLPNGVWQVNLALIGNRNLTSLIVKRFQPPRLGRCIRQLGRTVKNLSLIHI